MFSPTLNSIRSTKERRALQVLMGLVELHLKTGKPIGSQTLKQGGFDHMSSATLRNYFAFLEAEGFLRQAHISGGRLPTNAAFYIYAEKVMQQLKEHFQSGQGQTTPFARAPEEDKELGNWVEAIGAELARTTRCGIALLLPRFAHDFAARIQLVLLNPGRLLAIICTQYGLVHTITIQIESALSQQSIELAQAYCNWRINPQQSCPTLTDAEERFCSQLHSEITIRHFIENSSAGQRELSMNGLSEILHHPEGGNAAVFAEFVSLFENKPGLQSLLGEVQNGQGAKFWIGDALEPFFPGARHCTIAGAAYQLHRTNVGALALIGPSRLPYRDVFAQLLRTCELLSRQLTKSVHKFHIELRPRQKGNSAAPPVISRGGKALLQLIAPEMSEKNR